ncbi:MAG: hypothetical protein ACRDKE_10270, partial [Solirubrobacterales bacterium]
PTVYLNADPENPRSVYIAIDITQLGEGQHVVQGHAFPVGGAIDGSSGFSNFYKQFIVEHSIPDLTFSSSVADGASTAANDFTWTFNSIDAGAYRCSIDGAAYQACSSPVSLNDQTDGQHSFHVYARDQAANESPPQGVIYTVNSAWASPPETTFTSKPAEPNALAAATFAFESTTATSFECSLDGGAYATCTSPHTVAGFAAGQHALSVRGIDPTGQVEPTPETALFTLGAPAITPIPPLLPAPKVTGASGKAKKLTVSVSGPGTVAVKVETCAKKKRKTVCKKFTTGSATPTAAGKLSITLKKALKKKAKYRLTFTGMSPSLTGANTKSVATIRTK